MDALVLISIRLLFYPINTNICVFEGLKWYNKVIKGRIKTLSILEIRMSKFKEEILADDKNIAEIIQWFDTSAKQFKSIATLIGQMDSDARAVLINGFISGQGSAYFSESDIHNLIGSNPNLSESRHFKKLRRACWSKFGQSFFDHGICDIAYRSFIQAISDSPIVSLEQLEIEIEKFEPYQHMSDKIYSFFDSVGVDLSINLNHFAFTINPDENASKVNQFFSLMAECYALFRKSPEHLYIASSGNLEEFTKASKAFTKSKNEFFEVTFYKNNNVKIKMAVSGILDGLIRNNHH